MTTTSQREDRVHASLYGGNPYNFFSGQEALRQVLPMSGDEDLYIQNGDHRNCHPDFETVYMEGENGGVSPFVICKRIRDSDPNSPTFGMAKTSMAINTSTSPWRRGNKKLLDNAYNFHLGGRRKFNRHEIEASLKYGEGGYPLEASRVKTGRYTRTLAPGTPGSCGVPRESAKKRSISYSPAEYSCSGVPSPFLGGDPTRRLPNEDYLIANGYLARETTFNGIGISYGNGDGSRYGQGNDVSNRPVEPVSYIHSEGGSGRHKAFS